MAGVGSRERKIFPLLALHSVVVSNRFERGRSRGLAARRLGFEKTVSVGSTKLHGGTIVGYTQKPPTSGSRYVERFARRLERLPCGPRSRSLVEWPSLGRLVVYHPSGRNHPVEQFWGSRLETLAASRRRRTCGSMPPSTPLLPA